MPGKNYWKGYNDEKKSEKRPVDPIGDFLHSNYNPPSDSEDKAEYDAGWDRAKKDK